MTAELAVSGSLLDIPIVFRDTEIEVGGVVLPGYLKDSVRVTATLVESGRPLYEVAVTFMTELQPAIDPDATQLHVAGGDREITVTAGRTFPMPG